MFRQPQRMTRRLRKGLFATVGTATLLAGGTAAIAAAAQPADAAVCTHRTNVTHDDTNGGVYHKVWHSDSVCGNDAGAGVFALASGSLRIGTMDSTSSWFLCWVHGDQHAGGNDIWYYTQGDRVDSHPEWHAWGFMPAVNVHTTNDPGDSRLSECPTGLLETGPQR